MSEVLRLREIGKANRQVQAARDEGERKKRGSYNKYDDTERAAIGKYACQYAPAAAVRYFSRKLGKRVSKNTVKSIKKENMAESRKCPCDESVDHLPAKKRGRKVLLGSEVDAKVHAYVRQVRQGGGFVSSRIVIAGAKGILLSSNRSLLTEK